MTISPSSLRFGMLQLDKKSFHGRLTEAQIRQMNRQANVLAPAFDALEGHGIYVSLSANPPENNRSNAFYWTRISNQQGGEPTQTSGSIHRAQDAIWPVMQVNNALVAGIDQLGKRAQAAEAQVKRLEQMQHRLQTLQELQGRLALLSRDFTSALNDQPAATFTPEGGLPMDDGISG